ncbi:MAG: hypothetical protein O7C98_06065, partial [Planctomycetota bacterium]|nr:hypothetical protein [Planctomycetota bacterium]
MKCKALLVLLLLAPAFAQDAGEVRLLTDDQVTRFLDRAEELERSKQWERVIDVLQPVLDEDPQVFPDLPPDSLKSLVYSHDGLLYRPARELCLQKLTVLPDEGIKAYRAAYDRAALKLLKAADAVPELAERLVRYAEVYDRYFISSYGDDALERAADMLMDLGRFYEALHLYRRLANLYPADTDRDMPLVLTKAAYCAARTSDPKTRDELLSRLVSQYPRARVLVEGEAVPAAELGNHPLLQVAEGDIAEVDTDEWPVTGGNRANARVSDDLPREIPRTPLWRKQLRERDARFVLDPGYDGRGPPNTRWRIAAPDRTIGATPSRQGLSEWVVQPYPTVRPVVARGWVLYKDYRHVCGRSVSSGTWINTGREDESADDARPDSDGKYEDYYRFLDYGGNRVTVDGDTLVFVDNKQVQPSGTRRYPNAVDVNSLSNGKLLWAWGRGLHANILAPSLLAAWEEDQSRYPDVFFRGPGLTRDGLLYTVVDHG